ncbi:MAG TPA: disulfide oxidoreductase [Clostridiales bacterium]|nr:MAG: disulfide oxidoreductase [Clostridiales bacterium GWD2_32_59]HAN10805.1 disulfide oxidoreductase [Clostridiales bacterium]
MIKITKEMTIKEVLNTDENLSEVLMGYGMHCLGCPMHTMETLEQACDGHGLDADILVDELNKQLEGKEE